ncbi:hypothetical protein NIES2111_09330 [Nostoc sp. NIES-2111]|nr:hypothetical protein NIES2111_09330 [Nostoc sp. NIES-2111]
MGAHPWHYFFPYSTDVNSALQALREQEFRTGRFGLATLRTLAYNLGLLETFDEEFSHSEESPEELIEEYGSVQAAIETVLDEYAEDGTNSILDMLEVSVVPKLSAVSPLSESDLLELFGTDKPTKEMVISSLIEEQNPQAWQKFWESIDRGEGRYIIVYRGNQPVEIFFAGYSFD